MYIYIFVANSPAEYIRHAVFFSFLNYYNTDVISCSNSSMTLDYLLRAVKSSNDAYTGVI